ncbi:hypothetical protein [Levilactobacillus zymae]|uniref:Uncharacterized protein n=1 Tax=Levilactobacillus zymae TaxID=267363 RepID=A0A1Y6JVI4_9LACO|nr:hypothetical protein [Levilactobacillus zymae]SMS13939.1 hypothetical protein LZ3411_0889 [Levilactobacillus zymae]
MKLLAAMLITLVPAGIVGGTLWVIFSWSLVGWLKWVVAFGGLLVGTLASLGVYWVLWPRPLPEDLQDDETPADHSGQQKKPLR